jgi:hypothetical protein
MRNASRVHALGIDVRSLEISRIITGDDDDDGVAAKKCYIHETKRYGIKQLQRR